VSPAHRPLRPSAPCGRTAAPAAVARRAAAAAPGAAVRRAAATALAAAAILLALAVPAGADTAAAPWRQAETVRSGLSAAQTELILGGRAAARREAATAARAYRGPLAAGIRTVAPAADRAARAAMTAAVAAAARGDGVELAAARGRLRGALLRGSAAVTLAAVRRGDVATARSWLLLREFRAATRLTRPGADATKAVDGLARRRIDAPAAAAAVQKDLLDAYQARQRALLAAADSAAAHGLRTPLAANAAQAAAYWPILAPRYAEDRGAAAAAAVGADFAAFATAARSFDVAGVRAARARLGRALEGFTAAPLTPDESARRAQQLLRFLALVPVEYGRGVKGMRVTQSFEIQEAVAFRGAAAAAFADLEDQLAKRDEARTEAVRTGIAELDGILAAATERTEGVAPADAVQRRGDRLEDDLGKVMPKAWQEPNDESDYDLIALTFDRMEAAVGAGQYRQAEQARLEAYAFFEFGPERRLKSFDPGLATDIEGLIWFGAAGKPGFAKLIADHKSRREVHETRLVLDSKLDDAAATLGDAASRTTVVTNAAIIVFREGLEAVLILAAITASFVGARRRMRRPVLVGAGLGLLVSVLTWVLAQTLLTSLERYGEKLEAVVGLIAIAVLLLIMNWFFHRVYWSEWIGRFHRRRRKLTGDEQAGFFSAQVIGLALLGLTSVYREGFETVLFLQSLELSAGTVAVLEGAGLGLALALGVAVFTFVLQRKLPYKKMLVATGLLIALVLVVMVGQTARTMQGTGWLPITPAPLDVPYWAGLWFGVFPTWETVGAQIAAFAFVVGSYFLAQEVKVRGPRRRRARGTEPSGSEAEREPVGVA
jgi:high-affinity iron transporter